MKLDFQSVSLCSEYYISPFRTRRFAPRFAPRFASSRFASLDLEERFRPDIILLDIGMPILDGYAACQRIRELPGGREILIIALTGWGQEEDLHKTTQAGFDAHLVKPVNPAVLTKLLDERIDKGRK